MSVALLLSSLLALIRQDRKVVYNDASVVTLVVIRTGIHQDLQAVLPAGRSVEVRNPRIPRIRREQRKFLITAVLCYITLRATFENVNTPFNQTKAFLVWLAKSLFHSSVFSHVYPWKYIYISIYIESDFQFPAALVSRLGASLHHPSRSRGIASRVYSSASGVIPSPPDPYISALFIDT